ncbi:MAG: hypothetical protein Q9216_001777 [Gyalolechia sp. 2 TL-2023]
MKRRRSSQSSVIAPEDLPLPEFEPPTPQAPKSVISESRALPLTSENLQLVPGSPPQQQRSRSSIPIDAKSKASVGSGTSCTPFEVRAFLGVHGMYLEDRGFLQEHPALIEVVDRILNRESKTDMRPESAEKIIKDVEKLALRKEPKFFESFWHRLFKDSHPVKDKTEDGKWVAVEWNVQGLDNNPNQEFRIGGVTALDPQNDLHEKILKEVPKVQHPKPDQAFGVDEAVFSKDENRINSVYINFAGISEGMYHTFSIKEFKGYGGSMVEAENQALRAGSILVEVNIFLWDKAGLRQISETGADLSTIAFSFCMTTETAKLFLHWAKVEAGMTKYTMSPLRQYMLGREDDLRELRRDIDRVLDWGTIDHLHGPCGVRNVLKQIALNMSRPRESGASNKSAKHNEGSLAGAAIREGDGKGKGKG